MEWNVLVWTKEEMEFKEGKKATSQQKTNRNTEEQT